MSDQIANHQAMFARAGGPPPRQQIFVVGSKTGGVNFVRGDQLQSSSAEALGVRSDCQEEEEETVENAVNGKRGRNKKKREKKKLNKRGGQNSPKTSVTEPTEHILQRGENQAGLETLSAV